MLNYSCVKHCFSKVFYTWWLDDVESHLIWKLTVDCVPSNKTVIRHYSKQMTRAWCENTLTHSKGFFLVINQDENGALRRMKMRTRTTVSYIWVLVYVYFNKDDTFGNSISESQMSPGFTFSLTSFKFG